MSSHTYWIKGGEFVDFADWVNHAASWLGPLCGVRRGTPVLCIDAKGRPCNIGYDFHRARDDGAFPVAFYIRNMSNAGLHAEIHARGPAKTADP